MPILNKDDSKELALFEDFVSNSPYGHCMQSVRWAQLKTNWDADYVYLKDADGKIKASLSILSVKNDGENAFMYAPRGPVCDVHDIDLVNELIKEAEPIAKKNNAFLLRMDPEFVYEDDLYKALKEGIDADNYRIRSRNLDNEHAFTNPRLNMVLDLEDFQGKDYVEDVLPSRKRYKINKSYKNGASTQLVKYGDEDYEKALDIFYQLTKIMADRQEIAHRPKEYFDRLMKAFGDQASLYLTGDDEEILSACIVISYTYKAFYMYAASSNHKRKLNASTQMNAIAIQDAIDAGYEEYDFGGVYNIDLKDGLYSFKHWYTDDEGLKELIGEIDIIYQEDLYEDFLNRDETID